jgi:hypothetical protein
MYKTVMSSTSDGHLNYTWSTYTTCHNSATGTVYDTADNIDVGQWWNGASGRYVIQKAFLFFDLASALPPEATITDAALGLYVYTDNSTVDFNITVCNGQPTYPHDPLETGDFNYAHYGTTGNYNSSSGWTAGSYHYVNFTSAYLDWLSLTATTKLTLRSDKEIASSSPTYGNNQFISFYGRNKGEAYAPILLLTYTAYQYQYVFHGPYYEDGTASSDNATLVYYPTEGNSSSITLCTAGDPYTVNVSSQIDHFIYNITSTTYNYSRVYYVEQAETDFYVFLPRTTDTIGRYQFRIIDLCGIGNSSFFSTNTVINGTSRAVEKMKTDTLNNMVFWCFQYNKYNLKITTTYGTYTESNWPAVDSSILKMITVTRDMFPVTSSENAFTVSAWRNTSYIGINYTDTTGTTAWIVYTILYRNNNEWATAYTQNDTLTGSTSASFWYTGAVNTTDYQVYVYAYSNGNTYTWTFSLPSPVENANPWTGIDALGNWPFPGEYLVGFVIVVMCLGCFSYADLALGVTSTWILGMFLMWRSWLPNNWALMGFCGLVVLFVDYKEAKKTEREL